MEFLRFWRAVAALIVKPSWDGAQTVIALAAFIVGAGSEFLPEALRGDGVRLASLVGGWKALAAAFIATAAYRLLVAPVKVWEQEVKRAEQAEARIGQRPELWPIADLFFHLNPSVVTGEVGPGWAKVGQAIRDELSLGHLRSFGRLMGRRFELTGEQSPLTEIPAAYWGESQFTYEFFPADHGNAQHTYPAPGMLPYSSLRVSKADALAIWPTRFPPEPRKKVVAG